jgi:hypothetical protein
MWMKVTINSRIKTTIKKIQCKRNLNQILINNIKQKLLHKLSLIAI